LNDKGLKIIINIADRYPEHAIERGKKKLVATQLYDSLSTLQRHGSLRQAKPSDAQQFKVIGRGVVMF
jgi:hypothetical protein